MFYESVEMSLNVREFVYNIESHGFYCRSTNTAHSHVNINEKKGAEGQKKTIIYKKCTIISRDNYIL